MSEKKYEKLESGEEFSAPLQADVSEKTVVYEGRSAYRSLVVISLCLITVTLVTALYYMRLFCATTMPLTYTDEAGRRQIVLASVVENYVEYYIEDPMNSEKTWIIDDFNTNLEIMKTEVEEYALCYVVELNHTEAVKPTNIVVDKLRADKRQFHTILTPDPEHISDKSVLGVRGSNLCQDVNVYWLRPMEDVIDVTDTSTSLNTTTVLIGGGSSRRQKRNIRECHTSCCWLVCCCDVHHFKWESSEYFTCKHVCNKCTSAYKSKIQKIC